MYQYEYKTIYIYIYICIYTPIYIHIFFEGVCLSLPLFDDLRFERTHELEDFAQWVALFCSHCRSRNQTEIGQ